MKLTCFRNGGDRFEALRMGENVIKTDFKTVRDGAEYNRLFVATAREVGGGGAF
jgi:hypothetical protein